MSRALPFAFLVLATAGPALALPPGARKDLAPPPPEQTPFVATDAKADPALKAAVDSPARPAADRARDVYRHPEKTLMFWGLKPGMTVVDLQPGGGYWTAILAPYLRATHGQYIAAGGAKGGPAFLAKFSDGARFGEVKYVAFGADTPAFVPPASVDMVITSRELHNWIGDHYLDRGFAQAFAALKPGGILAVEEHRADPHPQKPDASDGYVATDTAISAATKAGFKLAGASEINANPKDTKDYPFGVWTLPPTRQGPKAGDPPPASYDRARYDAIGESDRMTLRFIKPS
jgi:predicted methyltransferase